MKLNIRFNGFDETALDLGISLESFAGLSVAPKRVIAVRPLASVNRQPQLKPIILVQDKPNETQPQANFVKSETVDFALSNSDFGSPKKRLVSKMQPRLTVVQIMESQLALMGKQL